MKKITNLSVLLRLIISVIFTANSLFAQPPGTGWTIKWSDDFNGTAVDETKWKIDDDKIRSADKNKTCYERENVSVSGGILKLKVDNSGCDCAGTVYSGGAISSTGNFYNNKYGYYEARIKYNFTGPGFWGNFWMSSTESWPPEFDIAEVIANEQTKMTLAYHYYDASNVHKSSGSRPVCDWKQYHVYGVEWLEGQYLRFYIDGVKVFEPTVSMSYPPDEKMNVILRMGAFNSSTWGGLPDGTTVYPGYAEYDWVKVWSKTGATNNPPTVTLTAPANNSTYTAPATVNLAATASDADGSVTKVEFYNGSTKLGEDATSPYTYSWTNAVAGTYTLTAKATDNSGNTKSSTSVKITVIDNAADNSIWYEPFTGLADGTKTDAGTTAWSTARDSGVFEVISNEFSITDPGGEGIWTSQSIDISKYTSVDISVDLQGAGTLDASGSFMDYIKVYYVINSGTETLLTSKDGGFGDEDWHNFKKTGLSGNTLKVVIKSLVTGGGEFYYWDNIKVTTKDAVNNAPAVNITTPSDNTTYTAPAAVDIAAIASDADGTVSKVEFYNGATKLGEDASSPYAYTWNNVVAGTYTIVAKATDNSGNTKTSSSVTITVETAASSGTEIWLEQFTGLADSTTVDNGTTAWSTTRASGVFEVIANEFSITYGGGEGVWTSENIDITSASSVDLSLDLQGMGLLDASGPNIDYIKVYYVLDGGAETALFTQNGGFGDELWHTYSKKSLSGSTLKIVIRALISGGDEYYYWDNIKVTVAEKVNQAPTANLTAPVNNASYIAPADVTITASANDADGTVMKVEFYSGATKIGEDLTSPYSFTWTDVAEGNYSITAKAIDNNGASKVTAAIAIKVNKNVGLADEIDNLLIYPTYTAGIVNVLNAEGFVYTISTATGTICTSAKIENSKIDISTLSAGIYILQIRKDDTVIINRIVKE